MRICTRCSEPKPESEYSVDNRTPSGLNYYCSSCVSQRTAEWRERNPEKWREQQARRKSRRLKSGLPLQEYSPEQRKYKNARNSQHKAELSEISRDLASRKGIPWTVDDHLFILQNPSMTTFAVAISLGKTYGQVKNRKAYIKRRLESEKVRKCLVQSGCTWVAPGEPVPLDAETVVDAETRLPLKVRGIQSSA